MRNFRRSSRTLSTLNSSEISQALILNFFLCRPKAHFYDAVKPATPETKNSKPRLFNVLCDIKKSKIPNFRLQDGKNRQTPVIKNLQAPKGTWRHYYL